jgi:hypothetical protein
MLTEMKMATRTIRLAEATTTKMIQLWLGKYTTKKWMGGTGQPASDGMQRGEGGRAKQLVGGYYNGSTGKMRRRPMMMAIKAVQNSQGGG